MAGAGSQFCRRDEQFVLFGSASSNCHDYLTLQPQNCSVKYTHFLTGCYASPGTVLFDSGTFSIGGYTTGATENFYAADLGAGTGAGVIPGIGVDVPDDFTWTVTFSGLTGGENAGLALYDPPTVGSDALPNGDGWVNLGSGLVPANVSGNPLEFGAVFNGTPMVPPNLLIVHDGTNSVSVLWPDTGNYTLQQNSDLAEVGGLDNEQLHHQHQQRHQQHHHYAAFGQFVFQAGQSLIRIAAPSTTTPRPGSLLFNWLSLSFPLPAIQWKIQNLDRLKKSNPKKFAQKAEELRTQILG